MALAPPGMVTSKEPLSAVTEWASVSLLVTVISPPGLTVPGPVNTKLSMVIATCSVVIAGPDWDTGPEEATAAPVDPRPAPPTKAAVKATLRTFLLLIMMSSSGGVDGKTISWQSIDSTNFCPEPSAT